MKDIEGYIKSYEVGLITKMEALQGISKELEKAIFEEECRQFEEFKKFNELISK